VKAHMYINHQPEMVRATQTTTWRRLASRSTSTGKRYVHWNRWRFTDGHGMEGSTGRSDGTDGSRIAILPSCCRHSRPYSFSPYLHHNHDRDRSPTCAASSSRRSSCRSRSSTTCPRSTRASLTRPSPTAARFPWRGSGGAWWRVGWNVCVCGCVVYACMYACMRACMRVWRGGMGGVCGCVVGITHVPIDWLDRFDSCITRVYIDRSRRLTD